MKPGGKRHWIPSFFGTVEEHFTFYREICWRMIPSIMMSRVRHPPSPLCVKLRIYIMESFSGWPVNHYPSLLVITDHYWPDQPDISMLKPSLKSNFGPSANCDVANTHTSYSKWDKMQPEHGAIGWTQGSTMWRTAFDNLQPSHITRSIKNKFHDF